MDNYPSSEQIKQNSEELTSDIYHGNITCLDGVMSIQTRELIKRFGAQGADMTSLWAYTPLDWICPACGRKKEDIVRLNKNNQLMCRLVEHHDHMRELLKQRFEEKSISSTIIVADEISENFAKRSASMVSAFDNTVICDDCNIADISAKKASNAHKWFSFSPKELSEIVLPICNKPHKINADKAKSYWNENISTFNLRLRVLDRIAEIAASDTHWFQPTKYIYRPDVVEERGKAIINRYRAYGALELLVGGKKKQKNTDISAWRKKQYPTPTSSLTNGQIQHIAKVKMATQWSSVDDDWQCPSCNRNKTQIIKITKKNGWSFSLSTRSYYDQSSSRLTKKHTLCSDCGFVAERLGKEARTISKQNNGALSSLVGITEIKNVILPRNNARHNIDNDAVTKLLEVIVYRLTQ